METSYVPIIPLLVFTTLCSYVSATNGFNNLHKGLQFLPSGLKSNDYRGYYYGVIPRAFRPGFPEVRDVAAKSYKQEIYVAKDGSGDTNSVQAAVDMVPQNNRQPVKIFIRAGVYREKVLVPTHKPYISFIGQGRSVTIITWQDRASDKGVNGQVIGTLDSASVAIEADYFSATHITFQNTALFVNMRGAEGSQAVALRVTGDKASFIGCGMVGYQDTLFDHMGRHFFLNCFIQGYVDFIFGSGRSLYKGCHLHVKGGGYGAVAASQRNSPSEKSGFSFVNCKVTGGGGESSTGMTYLGRAWGRYALTVFIYCQFDNVVMPMGWSDWEDPSRRWTAFFAEYECSGPGYVPMQRVKWAKTLSYTQALPFMGTQFIDGDDWLDLHN
ncbi:hypothetical protein SUGI_0525120 [Cryptomeria japonica]|uniref:pectinesterase QRT1 n=1 Tax=Cryptomeria japonica TaxID=3369 RepID=UPI002408D548|nr:pectinesterase QRT1 [Cryptomeria japonica]GLJ26869.1 hypothetical protein SUGI_0525120 [Cryptomeria japonica]